MPTPEELRAPIAEGRAKLEAAIRAAASNWNGKAPGDAWTVKDAAEHVIPAEAFFATAVCTACGYPGIEFDRGIYETAAGALKALSAVSELSDGRLKYISAEDLEKEHESMGTVVDILTMNAAHLEEHAAQISAAANG